ncbi:MULTISPECIES: SDR family NAD(P)-dependent oxidoreductase [Thermomonospora]|uniref:3-oxoacyl-[acyl-carrier protein] reductase n=1 Tax=Thermomonospora cellulosilytica TaxID=1411118 RepID=A0A7W3RA66_9ACTN|nr:MULTISPECIES: 3-oxoacyl-ACP reductase family protein [Thermomonospora]MBA9005522.1 3-oxoacyl-[acyl-carrier protein] reductase [Thermomonospora cellulosilytica]
MIDLNGKKAVVTGGTRGIGRSVVLALARAGADVLTCARGEGEAAQSLARELKELGGDHQVVKADVGEPADVRRLAEEARTRYGRVDVLVHNAGVISHIPFEELPLEEWDRVLNTNLTSAYTLLQTLLPLLPEGASVINVGSRVATIGIPQRAHYTASKAGLIGFTRSAAKELGPRGIRVNVVAPGPVETEAEVPEEVRERYRRMIPLGRLGRGEEIAGAVLFLASDLASFVHGETIHVDGGI